MNMGIKQLAAKQFGDDQLKRAHDIIGDSASLKEKLAGFLEATPTRDQMLDFLESLKVAVAEDQLKHKIDTICKVAGIEQPTGADRLMAMQIGLLQEQNAILQSGITRTLNQSRSDAKASAEDGKGIFTAALGGMLIAAALSR